MIGPVPEIRDGRSDSPLGFRSEIGPHDGIARDVESVPNGGTDRTGERTIGA